MWMMPLHLHVNQKSDYNDDDDDCLKVYILFGYNPQVIFHIMNLVIFQTSFSRHNYI